MQRSSSSPQGSPHFAGTKTSPTWLRLATGQVLCSMHISRLCGETSRLKANKALVEEALVIRTATSVAEPAICTAPLPFRSPANSTRTAKGPAQMLGQEFRHVIDVTPKGCRDLCAKAAEETRAHREELLAWPRPNRRRACTRAPLSKRLTALSFLRALGPSRRRLCLQAAFCERLREKMLCRILLHPAGPHCSTRSVMICVELEKDFPCQSTACKPAAAPRTFMEYSNAAIHESQAGVRCLGSPRHVRPLCPCSKTDQTRFLTFRQQASMLLAHMAL